MATAAAHHMSEPRVGRPPARPGDALVSVSSAASRRPRLQPEPSAADRGVRGPSARRTPRLPSDATIVTLARNFVTAHLSRPLGAEELVGATGVPLRALRRALMAQTGLGVASFIHRTRLERAYAWFSSNRETRCQGEIAAALGFVSPAAFSRSYRRRFGESVTETRRRAVGQVDPGVLSQEKPGNIQITKGERDENE